MRHDFLEHFVDADSRFRRCEHGVVRIESDHVLDLLAHALRLGRRQIDFVDDREDVEIVVDGEIRIRERLRFDALRGVDDEHRAFTRGETARDFVREVDVARRVDQIEDVFVAVARFVAQSDGASLDRDPALALEIHVVEHLLVHLTHLDRAGLLQQTIGERRLAVIDVGDDREVTDTLWIGHAGNWLTRNAEVVIPC